jgi:hypothetical protein
MNHFRSTKIHCFLFFMSEFCFIVLFFSILQALITSLGESPFHTYRLYIDGNLNCVHAVFSVLEGSFPCLDIHSELDIRSTASSTSFVGPHADKS